MLFYNIIEDVKRTWKIPESDFGLLSKFESQADIYKRESELYRLIG